MLHGALVHDFQEKVVENMRSPCFFGQSGFL